MRAARNSGVTLAELMVAMAITTTILLATAQVMRASQQAIRVTAIEADLSVQAMNIVDRIANDLKDGITGSVSPNQASDSSSLSFWKCAGYGAGGMLHSNTITYEQWADPSCGAGTLTVRRTENGQSTDLTDALTPNGLIFYRDAASAPANDVWIIQVQLRKGDFLVTRFTKVQLKF